MQNEPLPELDFPLYLDPKNDVAFRRLFGKEGNRELILSLLNSLLGFKGEDVITDIKHLDTHLLPRSVDLRESIVDVLCEDQRHHQYIVELQVLKPVDFDKRALFYASKTYISQMLKGDNYSVLKKVYLIGILDHIMFPNTKGYKTEHRIMDRDSHDHTFKDFEFHIIELPKFTKNEDELSSVEDKWIYFFKTAERSKGVPRKVTEPEIISAYDKMAQFNWTRGEKDLYDRSILAEMDYRNIIAQKEIEAKEKAWKEATKVEQERYAKEKEEIVLKLFAKGIDLETIFESTGLSKQHIIEITKNIKC